MANTYLFWDGENPPAGWTVVSNSGGPFYHRFIRGNSTYGGTGGSETHTHTLSNFSCTGPSRTTNNIIPAGQKYYATHTHTHGIGTISCQSASSLPQYRELIVIRYTGEPSTLPAGIIAIFDETPPSGWTRYSEQDGYYIRGSDSAGATGGSNTHSHTVSGATGASDTNTPGQGGPTNLPNSAHDHGLNATSSSSSNEPPYITVYLGKKDTDGAIPTGLIAMFDGTPSSNWEVLSDEGGPFYQKFLKPANDYGTTGGSETHTHTVIGTTGYETSWDGFSAGFVGPNPVTAAMRHEHRISANLDSASHLPPYIDVIFAKYTGAPPPPPPPPKHPTTHLDKGPHPRSRMTFYPRLGL